MLFVGVSQIYSNSGFTYAILVKNDILLSIFNN